MDPSRATAPEPAPANEGSHQSLCWSSTIEERERARLTPGRTAVWSFGAARAGGLCGSPVERTTKRVVAGEQSFEGAEKEGEACLAQDVWTTFGPVLACSSIGSDIADTLDVTETGIALFRVRFGVDPGRVFKFGSEGFSLFFYNKFFPGFGKLSRFKLSAFRAS